MQWADGKIRCHWVSPANTTYLRYHDDEWGRLVHDDHILHICQVDKFLGDEDKKGLHAWNGFGKVAPAVEG